MERSILLFGCNYGIVYRGANNEEKITYIVNNQFIIWL